MFWNLIKGKRQPTPVLLPGESMVGGAWQATVHRVPKSQTRLNDFTFTFTVSSSSLVAQSVKDPPTVPETACSTGDWGSIPASGRSPGEENGNPLQYSCLENSIDRGARWAVVHGITKSIHTHTKHNMQYNQLQALQLESGFKSTQCILLVLRLWASNLHLFFFSVEN